MAQGRLAGKVAVVTGGGTGIGEAVVQRFAEEGASVAVLDVNEENAKASAAKAGALGGAAEAWRADVASEAEVASAIAAVRGKFGRLDVLVNNAAITGANKLAHECTLEEWERVFAVNVRGVFLCTKHAVPAMMERRTGSIVNFSSIYGLIGNDDIPPYHATKGAVLAMTRTDAICYAPYGIRVNAVHPGTTLTPLVRNLGAAYPGGLEGYIEMMKPKHPLTLGEPVDVANCVLFLASDEARFVTGSSLVCDGGYTAQ